MLESAGKSEFLGLLEQLVGAVGEHWSDWWVLGLLGAALGSWKC